MKEGNELGKRVRTLRMAKGWPQAHLATVCDVDERTIRRIENGEVTPALETLQALAQALDVECSELTWGAAEQPKPCAKLQLVPVSNGRQFFAALGGSHAHAVDADDAPCAEEAAVVRELLDAIESAEIWDDLSPGQRYDEEQRVSGILRRLEALNWGVGIARRVGTMKLPPNESVPNPESFPWITVRLRVIKWTAEKMEKLLPALRELVAELEEKGGGAKLQEGSSWHR